MAKNAGGLSRIVVAVDGSKSAQKAADMALNLAEDSGASLFVVGVSLIGGNEPALEAVSRVEEGELDGNMESASQGIKLNVTRSAVDQVVGAGKKRGLDVKGDLILADGSIVEAILDYQVEKKGDLIILGTRGRGGFKRLLMGSTSNAVVTHANCSVMVVR
jgi:nucleotide-binding universal stress UspA family protein